MRGPRLIVLQPTPYCNIACSYCYLTRRDDRRVMSNEVVDAVCEKIVARLPSDSSPTIAWHAGEPTAAPIQWYQYAWEQLSSVCPSQTAFIMQSNGVAIDDRWIDLFRRTKTEVGLSIDGPQRFHDRRRRTRSGGPTWSLAMRGLRLLQNAGFQPAVITVLQPDSLDCAEEYYRFYRDHGITEASFSIDEVEGANATSGFDGADYKTRIADFFVELLEQAFRERFPLRIREVERVAGVLAGEASVYNEQIEPWDVVVIAADGSVSTFSPEFMEVSAARYGNFVFGNILHGDFKDFAATPAFRRVEAEIAAGVAACRSNCRYFAVCGGGAPVNKLCEMDDLTCTETAFCRYTVQAAADALLSFIAARDAASRVSAAVPELVAARQ
jgi:uncharacterized protein